MPKFVTQYNDPIHLLEIRNSQRKRYYNLTSKFTRRAWSSEEDELVLNSPLTDRELAEKMDRSVQAIQIRRCKLKKR